MKHTKGHQMTTTIKAIWFFLTNWPTLKAWFEKVRKYLARTE